MTPNDTAKAVAEAHNESRADGGPGQPVDVAADRYILESELQNRQTDSAQCPSNGETDRVVIEILPSPHLLLALFKMTPRGGWLLMFVDRFNGSTVCDI